MPAIRFGHADTKLGPMWVAETDAGIAAVSRSDALEAFLAPLRRRFPDSVFIPATIDAGWVDGDSVPTVDMRGLAAFDRRVYEAVRAIPAGETMTYGEVAAVIGSPGAARAVGNAMARCPLFPAVPCHRVVRASDGWSGWDGDPALKRRLLRAERRERPSPAK
ncbi:MAG TPA: methylated-DNA--[protein]-cysteine S-methyltransferase [Candidatus Limnocylindria bacterium]|nr:methylated-DNA--[protein]-cysteine S-methyltransferase [Candidatus Limnocylindria bacterium]